MSHSATVHATPMPNPARATPYGRPLRNSQPATTLMTIQAKTHNMLAQMTARARLTSLRLAVIAASRPLFPGKVPMAMSETPCAIGYGLTTDTAGGGRDGTRGP